MFIRTVHNINNAKRKFLCVLISYLFYPPFGNCLFQGLNPGRAIAEIKKLLGGVAKKDEPGLKATAI